MNSLTLIARSLRHFKRMHAGLFLGTALAASILTGALLVGDSAHFTLRTHALARLGGIEIAVFTGERTFSQSLALDFKSRRFPAPASALLLRGMAIHQDASTGEQVQANRVQVTGVDSDFWLLASRTIVVLGKDEAAIDERLAAKLNVKIGDMIAVRIAVPSLLSRDAPLSSREEDAARRVNVRVAAVLDDAHLGRFSLTATQFPPYNVFVRLGDLQAHVDQQEQINMLLWGSNLNQVTAQGALKKVWKPQYSGLRLRRGEGGGIQLESNRIFVDQAVADAALAMPETQGVLTYLVNKIGKGDRFTPYSFMTAGACVEGFGDDEIAINSWLAETLAAKEGDRIAVAYYEVLPSNEFVERSREFTVRRVIPIEELALEKDLVPEFPGLSDVESCADWKIGMPMDETMLNDKPNESYWKQYRQTPKAFVTLRAGQAMWGNRFGNLTAVRFHDPSATEEAIESALAENVDPTSLGLTAEIVLHNALKAVNEAIDLGGLFLGMSFFLLISALILTALLYALGVQQRAGELGLMLAVGLGRNRVLAQLLGEALAVSLPASVIGALLGLAYAQALLAGLARYWSGAVGNIPILFHATVSSVATGAFATILCALAVTLLCLWRLMQRPARELLQGDFTQARLSVRSGKFGRIAAVVALIAAALTTLLTFATNAADVSMSFFLSGTLVLLAGILIARDILVRAAFPRSAGAPTPWRIAVLNASRRRTRSLGMVATLASGCFLVLAVSSMQKDPAANADQPWSGTGGFSLYAETTTPLIDPNAVSAAMPGLTTVALRVRDGDDASCLNLNHAQTPRILGVNPRAMAALGAFLPTMDDKLWERLDAEGGDDVIPAFAGDANTAMWGLKKRIGDTIEITDDAGKKTQLKLVGTLPTALSVLQGTVLVSDASFTRLWPSEQGFRAFLIKTPAPPAPESLRQLQAAFSRDGMEVTPTIERLRMFYAVESTYLSMFLALGGLGVLLGATATGIVVMRNVFERRRELALMHALGFARNTVFNLLLREHVLLLLMGMAIGVGAAAVAMAPTIASAKFGADTLSQIVVPLGAMLLALVSIWAGLTLALRKTGVSALRAE